MDIVDVARGDLVDDLCDDPYRLCAVIVFVVLSPYPQVVPVDQDPYAAEAGSVQRHRQPLIYRGSLVFLFFPVRRIIDRDHGLADVKVHRKVDPKLLPPLVAHINLCEPERLPAKAVIKLGGHRALEVLCLGGVARLLVILDRVVFDHQCVVIGDGPLDTPEELRIL